MKLHKHPDTDYPGAEVFIAAYVAVLAFSFAGIIWALVDAYVLH